MATTFVQPSPFPAPPVVPTGDTPGHLETTGLGNGVAADRTRATAAAPDGASTGLQLSDFRRIRTLGTGRLFSCSVIASTSTAVYQ